MSLSLHKWATPLVAGSFLLMAVTGILMFFHLDSGLNKEAHEWLGWAFVIGAGFHLFSHFPAFMKKFQKPLTKIIVGTFATLLLLSFIPLEEGEGNGKMVARASMDGLMAAPISVVAQVAHKNPDELISALKAEGIDISSPDISLEEALGGDHEKAIGALSLAFKK